MKNYRRLLKVFLKDIAYDPPKDKGRKAQILILSIFAVVFIMIPVAVAGGTMLWYEKLKPALPAVGDDFPEGAATGEIPDARGSTIPASVPESPASARE